MTNEIAISVEAVSKAYRIWNSPASRLLSPAWSTAGDLWPESSSVARKLHAKAASHYRDFWALNAVSFTVKKGEAMGVVGRNGSGKSTLLQIIAGTLQPTSGTVKMNGRVAALLELGSGFNPDFTGRENVYINGAILGLTRAEIDARFDDIAAFADIGKFIEQPVKIYSSGMMVRLAFAVQIAVDPDILIIDEALAVGDIFFQQKCFKRLHKLREQGTAFLLVSHEASSIANLCSKALWLAEGHVQQYGSADEVTRAYLIAGGTGTIGRNSQGTFHVEEEIANINQLPPSSALVDLSKCKRTGNQKVEITKLWLGDETSYLTPIGNWIELVVLIEAKRDLSNVSVGFEIRDRMGQVMCANGLRVKGLLISKMSAGETRLVKIRFQNLLTQGVYTLDVGCGDSDPNNNASDRVVGAMVIKSTVTQNTEIVHGFYRVPADFTVLSWHK